MTYPYSLIPIPSWVKNIEIDSLPQDERGFSVVRRISGNLEELISQHPDWVEDKGKEGYALTLAADIPDMDTKWMPKMSMNIISDVCGFFESSFRHGMLDKEDSEWDGKWVNPRKFVNFLKDGKPCFFLEIRANMLHHQPFDFTMQPNSQAEFDKHKDKLKEVADLPPDKKEIVLKAFSKSFSKSKKYLMCDKIKLFHSPTPLNYWHMMMDIGVQRADKGWKYDLGRTVRTIIRNYGRIRSNDCLCSKMEEKTYRLKDVSDWIYLGHRMKQQLGTMCIAI